MPTTEFIRSEGMGGGVGGMVYSIKDDGNGGVSIISSHANHRGDVIARSNESRSLTSFALYEAYGTRPYEWGDDPDRQKANTKEEEKDLDFLIEGFRIRCLDTGVFMTRDPIGYVDGPNIYCYVKCNPIMRFDPLGLIINDDDLSDDDKESIANMRDEDHETYDEEFADQYDLLHESDKVWTLSSSAFKTKEGEFTDDPNKGTYAPGVYDRNENGGTLRWTSKVEWHNDKEAYNKKDLPFNAPGYHWSSIVTHEFQHLIDANQGQIASYRNNVVPGLGKGVTESETRADQRLNDNLST